MNKKTTPDAEKASLQQKIASAQNQIKTLEEKDTEKRLYFIELSKKDKKIINKYNELYDCCVTITWVSW